MNKKYSHAEIVARLAKPGQDILSSLTPLRCHVWHMLTGLAGEVLELQQSFFFTENAGEEMHLVLTKGKNNFVEECGDVEFYLEGLAQAYDVKLPIDNTDLFGKILDPLTLEDALEDLLNKIKKDIIYLNPNQYVEIQTAIKVFSVSMQEIYKQSGLTREQCIEANIFKLQQRYPGYTYSDTSANERKDKKL